MATEPDKVDSGVLGTLLAVLTFGVLATALAVTALVRRANDELVAERSEANDAFAALRGSQEADLHLPAAYIDKEAGKVRLPIDRAMQVVVRDLRRNPQSATWPSSKQAQANGGAGDSAEEAEKPAAGEAQADAEDDARERDEPGVKPAPAPRAPAAPQAPKAPAAPQAPKPAPKAPAAPQAPKPAPKAPAPPPAVPKPAPAAPKPPPVAPKPPAPPPVVPPAP